METLQGFTWEFLNSLFYYEDGLVRRKVKRGPRLAHAVVGSVDGKGYLHVNVEGKFVRLHKLIYFLFHKTVPQEVDHKDRDRRNNRIDNLRGATRQQNSGNIGMFKHNTSGFKGVVYIKGKNKWDARIKINGKQVYLGRRSTPEEASQLYEAAARQHFGEFVGKNHAD
jgi:hypothetical protein